MSTSILVDDIELPVAIKDFITPDLAKACDFYPTFVVKSALRDRGFRTFQSYLLEVCYQLEKHQAREGRSRSQYFTRFLEHFGIATFESYCREYQLPLPRIPSRRPHPPLPPGVDRGDRTAL